ncbi:MAG: sigma-70 family RNA polymerase sigma factor [Phycisphaerales bacterium]|nr:sigma-70 family RNA polymerase sigma factor [Phycisphaerales bacterium]
MAVVLATHLRATQSNGPVASSRSTVDVDVSRDPAARADARPGEVCIRDLWDEYRAFGGETLRNRIAEHYMNRHVRRIADRVHRQLPAQIDIDDIRQLASIGLLEAIEGYDPDRGVAFEQYSVLVIRGRIFDHLRANDPVPRTTRDRQKRYQRAMDGFTTVHGRRPTDHELCEALGLRLADDHRAFRRFVDAAGAPMTVSIPTLSSPSADDPADGPSIETLSDPTQESPLTEVEKTDLKAWITRGMERSDRLIVTLYYYERLTMSEIGAALGISESRVSQRLGDIKRSLKARFTRAVEQDTLLLP